MPYVSMIKGLPGWGDDAVQMSAVSALPSGCGKWEEDAPDG